MANIIMKVFAWLLLERKIQGKSYQQYNQRFQESSSYIQNLIDLAEANQKNRWELLHIIGMERWMQSRMKVALGALLVQEEYDGYRPPDDTSWHDLKQMFIDVRKDSCDLCAKFDAKNVDPAQKIEHNSVGPLSVKAWMEYVVSHSNRHANKMTSKA